MCLEVPQAGLSELPRRLHSCPLSLTLVHSVLSCGPPYVVVTVRHPPILAEHGWRGVGFGTSPFDHSANPSHTPMELISLVQTG